MCTIPRSVILSIYLSLTLASISEIATVVRYGDFILAANPTSHLIDVITESIAEDSWIHVGGPGSLQGFTCNGKHSLVVSQTARVHCQIDRLIKELQEQHIASTGSSESNDLDLDTDEMSLRVYCIGPDSQVDAEECVKLVKLCKTNKDGQLECQTAVALGSTIAVRATERFHTKFHVVLSQLGVLRVSRVGSGFGF